MDATDILTADHNRARGMVNRLEQAKEAGELRIMTHLVDLLFEELRVHTTVEEEVFYPTIRRTSDEIGDLVDEGLEEHHVVDVLMDEIVALEPGTDEWTAKLTVLVENLTHHIDEEESDLFPKVRGAMSADELTGLAGRMEACKSDLGAPTVADKADLTAAQLADLAREQKIPGRSSMDKDELAATVAPPQQG